MHLVACATPPEPLEAAPRSTLLGDAVTGERWDAFWSADAYVVRCTRAGGAIEWFVVADEQVPAGSRSGEPHVLTIRPKTRSQSRVSVVVAQSPDGRRMLVGGTTRRTAR